jgi:uncharacterized membrane protein YdjX (TVP38/TMEM64 family)
LHEHFSWDGLRQNLSDLQSSAAENLPLALLVFFAVYVAVTGLSLPVAVWLSLLGGALFGRWLGTGVVLTAATVGATLAMLAARYVLRDWVRARFGRRLERINRGVERDGAYYLLTLRLIPAVPFWLINLGMGLTPMSARTFAAVSWVGMLPGTFVYVNAGTELGRLESPADVLSWPVIVAFVLLGCLPLVARLGRRRAAA